MAGHICFGLDIKKIFFSYAPLSGGLDIALSHDIASGSDITPCNKIHNPLVVYRFSGNGNNAFNLTHVVKP